MNSTLRKHLARLMTLLLLCTLLPAGAVSVSADPVHSITLNITTWDQNAHIIEPDETGGSVTMPSSGASGELIEYDVHPAKGYMVKLISVGDGVVVGDIRTYFNDFVMPDQDVVVDVLFQKRSTDMSSGKLHKVTVEDGVALDHPDSENGNIIYWEKDEQVFPILDESKIPSGKYFVQWDTDDVIVEGQFIESVLRYPYFIMPDKDVTLKPAYADQQIMIINTDTGNMSPHDPQFLTDSIEKAAEQGAIKLYGSGMDRVIDLDLDGTGDVYYYSLQKTKTCSINAKQAGFEVKNAKYSPVVFDFTWNPYEWPFKDVTEDPSDWVYTAVKYVYEHGLMSGMKSDWFGYDQPLTREQFAVILWRMHGSPEMAYSAKFPDVPDEEWYTDPILWASSNGIVTGYANGTFGVGDTITREQMITMLGRYAKFLGYDISSDVNLANYPDGKSVSDWAVPYMKWAIEIGIIHGEGGTGLLNPAGKVNRAVGATIIMNYVEGTSS